VTKHDPREGAEEVEAGVDERLRCLQ
jgi:hypothetical protein